MKRPYEKPKLPIKGAPMINTGKGKKQEMGPDGIVRTYIDSKPEEDWSEEQIKQQQADQIKAREQFARDYEAAEERVPASVRKLAIRREVEELARAAARRGEIGGQ